MKYLFIDSNQYYHLFSSDEGFSDEIHKLICELHDTDHVKLLVPQQTSEEVNRNKVRKWPESHEKKKKSRINTIRAKAEKLEAEYAEYAKTGGLVGDINKDADRLERRLGEELKQFTSKRSKANTKLASLLKDRAITIVETNSIYDAAVRRQKKGNPPYGETLGDHLIWESLIQHLEGEIRPELIFVSNDSTAWGKSSPDTWLVDEFKKRTNGSIIFVNRLSDIPGLTKEEVEKIREAEQKAIVSNRLSDFIHSASFVEAGENIRRLLKYKDALDESDLTLAFDAARTNHEIYQSFFTSGHLNELFRDGETEYAQAALESIDKSQWDDFVRKNNITLKRQIDEEEESNEINWDNIPF